MGKPPIEGVSASTADGPSTRRRERPSAAPGTSDASPASLAAAMLLPNESTSCGGEEAQGGNEAGGEGKLVKCEVRKGVTYVFYVV